MAATQFTLNNDSLASNGTSNLTGLLEPHQQQALRLVMPRDMEKVFGLGIEDLYEPDRGYEYPEWYFKASDGCVWGIGWRWGQARLRGRGPKGIWEDRPVREQATEFVNFIIEELA
jgi:hypothetical protein